MQSIHVNLRHLMLCACLAFGIQNDLNAQSLSAQNLIPNPSFETGGLLCGHQGQMPVPWLIVTSTPDTYDFNCPGPNAMGGIHPHTDFPNFSSMSSAEDGFRFVAGWSAAQENMGVPLISALVPGHNYVMRGWFARPDIHEGQGFYNVYIAPSPNSLSGIVLVGSIGGNVATTAMGAWTLDAFEFTAPAGADQLPNLILQPMGADYYVAVDDLFLTEVFAPTTFCAGKVNSLGCLPAISSPGTPSYSGGSFSVDASLIVPNKNGFLFYGIATNNQPFQGGTLCVAQPLKRTPPQNSGGSLPGCTGVFSYSFDVLIHSHSNPSLLPGQLVSAQYYYRDPQDPAGFMSGLTDGVYFTIRP